MSYRYGGGPRAASEPKVRSSAGLGRWQQAMLLVGAMITINGGMDEKDAMWKYVSLALAVLIVWVVLLSRDKRPNSQITQPGCLIPTQNTETKP